MTERDEQSTLGDKPPQSAAQHSVNAQNKASRRWCRLHASTYVAMLLAAAVFILLCVPGQYVTHLVVNLPQQFPLDFGVGHRIEHGWPAVYLTRDSDNVSFPLSFRFAPSPPAPSLWRLNERVVELSLPFLLLDGSIGLAIVAIVGVVCERRRRLRTRFWQFTIGDLLICMAVLAIGLGRLVWLRHDYQQEQNAIGSLLDDEFVAQRDVGGGYRTGSSSYIMWQSDFPSWIAALAQPEWSQWFDRVMFAKIAPARLEHVRHFKRLRFLRLDDRQQYCDLDHVALLEDLRELEVIDFTGGGISSNEVQVERGFLPKEKSDRNFTRAMASLKTLPKLRALYLGDTDVSDAALDVIADFPAIEVLDLGGRLGANIGDVGLTHLTQMRRLRGLYLKDRNRWHLTDATVPLLARIQALELLWISSPDVSDKSLAHLTCLTELRELNLSGTSITGKGMEQLKQLRHLQTLVVPKAAEQAALKLRESLPQLKVTVE